MKRVNADPSCHSNIIKVIVAPERALPSPCFCSVIADVWTMQAFAFQIGKHVAWGKRGGIALQVVGYVRMYFFTLLLWEGRGGGEP